MKSIPKLQLLVVSFLLLCFAVPNRGQTVTATIGAGTAPALIALNPVTNKVYVRNAGDNTVTVIDGATNATTTVVVAGMAPTGDIACEPGN